ALALRLGQRPDGHGPVVAAGALALLAPAGRVLLQEGQAALGRLAGPFGGGGGGAGRPGADGQEAERGQRHAGARAGVHGRRPFGGGAAAEGRITAGQTTRYRPAPGPACQGPAGPFPLCFSTARAYTYP